MADLGKVAIRPRGEWVIGLVYERLDVVVHNLNTYLALKDNAAEPSDDGENWMLLLEGVPVATTETAGKAKPDGDTITVDEDGTLHGASQVPEGVTFIDLESSDEALPEKVPVNADQLGGQNPEYYATAENLEKIVSGETTAGKAMDADTVDGYHMSDYFEVPTEVIPDGADLNSYLTPGIYRCNTKANALTLLNIPAASSGFKLIVKNMVGTTNIIQYIECVGKVFFRTLTSDLSNVQPWKGLDDYLPLTGGTLTGVLMLFSGYGRLGCNKLSSSLASINDVGGYLTNSRTISINNSNSRTLDKCFLIRDIIDGVATDYSILHTGNSKRFIEDTTAPTDTTVAWIDTANKKIKTYLDGAWTPVS